MFPIFQASLAEARTPPLIPQWIEVSNVLWPQLQAAIVGEKTAQEALDYAFVDHVVTRAASTDTSNPVTEN